MIYKFRAECQVDVGAFLKNVPLEQLTYFKVFPDKELGLPDVEVEIEIQDFTLEDYHTAMRQVTDGHVMLQTIRPIEEYTGERNYDLI